MIVPASKLCAARNQKADNDKIMRMGDLIVAHTRETGSCTDDALLQAGFTSDDIRQLGPQAKTYAARQISGGGNAA